MNYFDGLISDQFKQFHVDMITEVIRGCSVECTLIYGTTLYIDCANCIFDPIGNKSSNRYQSGGPAEFTVGVCPMCAGTGKIPQDQTDIINLCPIYDYKRWLFSQGADIASPQGFVQTISAFSTFESIVQAKEILIDNSISANVRARFERYREPQPCGLGGSEFIGTIWKRIENK